MDIDYELGCNIKTSEDMEDEFVEEKEEFVEEKEKLVEEKEEKNDIENKEINIENKINKIEASEEDNVNQDKASEGDNANQDEILREKERKIIQYETELSKSKKVERKIIDNTLKILDKMYDLHNCALELNDITLIENLEINFKIIKKDLEKIGLNQIEDVGELFNTKVHYGIGTVDCENAEDDKKIIKVIKKGYFYNGELYRKAEVIVNKKINSKV